MRRLNFVIIVLFLIGVVNKDELMNKIIVVMYGEQPFVAEWCMSQILQLIIERPRGKTNTLHQCFPSGFIFS